MSKIKEKLYENTLILSTNSRDGSLSMDGLFKIN